jgi:AsmA protein
MKAMKIAGAAVAALIVIVVLLMVVGLPSGFLTSAIQDRVERATGYHLTIAGSTKISLWPSLNVSISDLTLQDPKDRDGSNRITIENLQVDMTLASAWSGHPHITELVVTKPVFYVPLLRERLRPTAPANKAAGLDPDEVTIERITISNGAIAFSNARDHVDNRIDGIAGLATIDADRNIKFAGIARAGDHPLKFDIKAAVPSGPVERQNIPIEATFEAPGLLNGPLTSKAEVRMNGSVAMINGLSGTLGDGAFNGWASVDLSSKPLVKLDLDFQRLDIPMSKSVEDAGRPGWSDRPFDLTALNYVDAQARISAAQIDLGEARFAPAAIEAALAGGVLKASVSNLGVYGGQASGEVIVDASSGSPNYAMHCDLVGVRALPLLSSLAEFDKIDGKMQAKIAAKSGGASQHAIMSNMSGTAFVIFQDGQIRGLNIAQMIRNLTASTLSGWQEQKEQGTDLTQLSASFKIDHGQATTTDLNLVGPLVKVTGAGTIDLGTKQIGFRVEPQIVMTTEGQGRAADPVGFGIPVILSGPWSGPKIYPDMAGVLDNPDAAYAKLREMGKGLFGPNGAGLDKLLSGLGGGGLGTALGGLAGNQPGTTTGTTSSTTSGGNQTGPLGGLGQTLGTLIQQGLGNMNSGGTGTTTPPRGRSIPSPQTQTQTQAAPQAQPAPAAAPQPQAEASPPPPPPDSQPMNDVLRQLFNR